MRTGILGGTFNPPHLGASARGTAGAAIALALDRVLFIPTNIPPHKALPEHTATAADRCEMVRLLTEGHAVGPAGHAWKSTRGGASYTVDTLHALHARGDRTLYLIVGTDMLLSFDRIWRAPDEIVQLCTLGGLCPRGRG